MPFILMTLALFIDNNAFTQQTDWWNERPLPVYEIKSDAIQMPAIHVKDNMFVNAKGKKVVFRGLSISDPDKLVKNGKWSRSHFEVIREWGANIVRIPVHPVSIHQRGLADYLQILDEAVDWCSALGMYVIIDWHTIGNPRMEMYQNRMYDTSQKETYNFWKTISRHYQGVPAVAFYEIFNEPTVFRGTLGTCTWEEWKTIATDIIDIIFAYDTEVIPLVGGFDWAYDLSPVDESPVEREGIGYVTHPYPGKCKPPREPQWEEKFGFLASRYPIIATELGYLHATPENHLHEDGTYGPTITRYLEDKGISWVVWVFDPDWVPQMIENWDYEPTHQGVFFREKMERMNSDSGRQD